MRIALITRDKPKHLQVRLDNREAHLAYIEKTGVVEMAGPFLDNSGQMSGSLIILDVEDITVAEAWVFCGPCFSNSHILNIKNNKRAAHLAAIV